MPLPQPTASLLFFVAELTTGRKEVVVFLIQKSEAEWEKGKRLRKKRLGERWIEKRIYRHFLLSLLISFRFQSFVTIWFSGLWSGKQDFFS